MSVTTLAPVPHAVSDDSVLSPAERWSLGMRMMVALLALGLLVIAILWQTAFPEQSQVADLVAGLAAALVAIPVVTAAWHSLRHPSLHGVTDQLIAMALSAAWATGELMTAAILPIVMIVGHVLEERSLIGSQEAIRSLNRLTHVGARRRRADGSLEEVAAEALRPGDHVELRAGDRVPTDGIVREGSSSVDLASITGESVPVEVEAGGNVFAGGINLQGRLLIEVTRTGEDTTLGRVVALMQTAERSKPPVTRLLERYAGRYTLFVLLLAAATWFATNNTDAMLAVLVASCPCALVLAAPATAVAAVAVAARHGILIKGVGFLEQLADVTSVIFDKTGTVTLGHLDIVGAKPAQGVEESELMSIGAALGAASTHPVSRALAAAIPEAERPAVTALSEGHGLGVTGLIDGRKALLGRTALLQAQGVVCPELPAHDGPVVGVALAGRFLGWVMLADEPRPEAAAAIAELGALGLRRQILLTGDREAVARRIAGLVGIADVQAQALPQDKLARVLAEIRAGQRPLVIGDGINDSLALKAGAVGMALGAQGADIAAASADIVLVANDLRRVPTCIRLSRRCRSTLAVNVGLGLGWTLVVIVAAATGSLGPSGALIAAVLHNLGTFAVLANAGRLLRFDETGTIRREPARVDTREGLAGSAG
ncbi:heavy metal-(Cd/Co/Hg/Pb/Zn)-translocating P-type ATPase [Rhizobiales bacterium GAS113]|nr:heavy metal-(Cd/Co/Hg/Pb/Zn)-translocating P-type ATPase [Rhizobiales bacterium GAS113]